MNAFYNTGHYLLRAAKRLHAPVEQLPKEWDSSPERVLNVQPCGFMKGTKMTGFYEIDYWCYPDHKLEWENADVVFSCDPYLGGENFEVPTREYVVLPLGVDLEMLNEARKVPKSLNATFIGTLGGGYELRGNFLEAIKNEIGDVLLEGSHLPSEEYLKTLAGGKIIFNHSLRNDCNRRFWEGMAVGVVVTSRLSQFKMFPDFYGQEGVQFVAYDGSAGGVNDCVGKIKSLLEDFERMARISEAGYFHILKTALYEYRLKTILEKML